MCEILNNMYLNLAGIRKYDCSLIKIAQQNIKSALI